MKARYKTAFRPKTALQNPDRLPAPNRLAKAADPARPGEILVSDFTYVATAQGWMYLAVTLDLFSRQIAGWHLAESMETALVVQAAQKASTGRGDHRQDHRGGELGNEKHRLCGNVREVFTVNAFQFFASK